MNFLSKKNIKYVSQVILGGTFVYASIGKILDSPSFAVVISNYKILPEFLVKPVAVVLPWIELIFGITLILGVWVKTSALILSFLLLVFIAAIFSTIIRGLNIDCGCFSKFVQEGEPPNANLWMSILRDVLFLLLGITIIFFSESKKKKNKI